MSGFVNVGFIYNIDISPPSEVLTKVIQKLLPENEVSVTIKYAIDEEGEEWIEKETSQIDESSIQEIISGYYGELSVRNASLLATNHDITITFENTDEYFGILISIEEESLIPKYDIRDLQRASTLLTSFAKQIFQEVNFAYAFTDHEAEILYPLDEKKYSIVFVPDEHSQLKVIENAWHINGLTMRK